MLTYSLYVILVAMAVVTLMLGFGVYLLFFHTKSSPLDPELERIAKEVLKNHFTSMEKGKLISKKHLGAELIDLLKKNASEFADILKRGVEVKSSVQDIDQIRIQILKQDVLSIKVRVHGYYQQQYLHGGRLIVNPSDPRSYASPNEIIEFDTGHYDLNFSKTAAGKYLLIGIDDSIMGNRLGTL